MKAFFDVIATDTELSIDVIGAACAVDDVDLGTYLDEQLAVYEIPAWKVADLTYAPYLEAVDIEDRAGRVDTALRMLRMHGEVIDDGELLQPFGPFAVIAALRSGSPRFSAATIVDRLKSPKGAPEPEHTELRMLHSVGAVDLCERVTSDGRHEFHLSTADRSIAWLAEGIDRYGDTARPSPALSSMQSSDPNQFHAFLASIVPVAHSECGLMHRCVIGHDDQEALDLNSDEPTKVAGRIASVHTGPFGAVASRGLVSDTGNMYSIDPIATGRLHEYLTTFVRTSTLLTMSALH